MLDFWGRWGTIKQIWGKDTNLGWEGAAAYWAYHKIIAVKGGVCILFFWGGGQITYLASAPMATSNLTPVDIHTMLDHRSAISHALLVSGQN